MKANLTSPRYRATIDLRAFNGADARHIRTGVLPISPGQWLTDDGGRTKRQFISASPRGIWVRHPQYDRLITR